jgi:hypothetical protein
VFGTGDAVAEGAGAYARDLTGYYRHAALQPASVQASVQTRNYLTQAHSQYADSPTNITGVLRSPSAWVDRHQLLVAYQLADARGSQVYSTAGVSVGYTVACDDATLSSVCAGTRDSNYVWFCSAVLPSAYFADNTQQCSVKLALSVNGQVVDSLSVADSLNVVQQPPWYDTGLRSTLGNTTIPAAGEACIPGGGVFITLPVSPVGANDAFDVYMFVNTDAWRLRSFTVELAYSDEYLECASGCESSFTQNAAFNKAGLTTSPGRLVFSVTGLADANAQTAGTAVFLFKISLKFKAGVEAGMYDGATLGLYPRAETLVNDAVYTFVSTTIGTQRGCAYDRRTGVQQFGQMLVDEAVGRGIFAYTTEPVLLNTARLGAPETHYSPMVVEVTSDPNAMSSTSVTPTACSVVQPSAPSDALTVGDNSPAIGFGVSEGQLALGGCDISMTHQQTESTAVLVTAAYGALTTTFRFAVSSPSGVSISAADEILNLIGNVGPACDSTTRYPYQSTLLKATGTVELPQGTFTLDLTNIVTFSVEAEAVASVGTGAQWNRLSGKSAGSATVRLGAHTASTSPTPPSLVVQVSIA